MPGREDPGKGDARPNGVEDRTVIEQHLAAALQVGRHRGKRQVEVFDAIAEMRPNEIETPASVEEAFARPRQIEEAKEPAG